MDDQLSDDERSPTARGNGHQAQPADEESPAAGSDDPAPASRPPDPRATYTGPIYSTRVKLTVALVMIASVAAISWVYLRTVDSNGNSSATDGAVASGVEGHQPSDGAQVPDQVRVGLDLTPGWDGTLAINGVVIPENELTRDRQAGSQDSGEDRPTMVEDRLEFVPGPDKVLERLPSGEVCVNATLRHRADPTRQRTFDWCFTVF